MSNDYAPMPDGKTRCLVCRCTPDKGNHWKLIKPGPNQREIFAAWFCSEDCVEAWKASDDQERMALIFGSSTTGISLLDDITASRYRIDTEPDAEGVPVFAPRLSVTQAAVRIWSEKEGREIPTGKVAPWHFRGYRQATPGGMARLW